MTRQIVTGFIIGILANILGISLASLFLGQSVQLFKTINLAFTEGFLSKLISLGAILNLLVFFYFIRSRKDQKAKGVLMATIVVALLSIYIKFTT